MNGVDVPCFAHRWFNDTAFAQVDSCQDWCVSCAASKADPRKQMLGLGMWRWFAPLNEAALRQEEEDREAERVSFSE